MFQNLDKKKIIIWGGAILVLIVLAVIFSSISSGVPKSIGDKLFSGVVKEASSSSIVVSATTLYKPGEVQNYEIIRTVLINEKTVIKKEEKKDEILFAKEMEDFNSKLAGGNGDTKMVPPKPFSEKMISVSDLKRGDHVTVIAKEDVADIETVTATSIRVNSSPAPINPQTEALLSVTLQGKIGWVGSDGKFGIDSFSDGTRTMILVDEHTELLKQIKKTDAEFKEELRAFNEIPADTASRAIAPSAFRTVPVKAISLQVGDIVEVKGFNGGGILNTKSVTVLLDVAAAK